MTVHVMPSTPAFADTRFGLMSNTQADLASPITDTAQLFELPSALWRGVYKLPSMSRTQAGLWQAFGVLLRGRSGLFRGFDPDALAPLGAAKTLNPGDILITLAPAPSGNSLPCTTPLLSTADVFLPGDFVSYKFGTEGAQMFMVTAAVNSDGAGDIVIPIEPPIRTPPSSSTLEFKPAWTTMRLDEDAFDWDASRISRYGITFAAAEVITR